VATSTAKAIKDVGNATKEAMESAFPSDAPKDATGNAVDGS